MRVLRTRRNVAHGLFGVRPTAAIEPLVGPPPPTKLSRSHHSQRSPRSPVTFSDECFRPPPSIADFVSFGQEDEEDSMSISGSEKEGWAESERDRSDSEGPTDLQEELIRVINKVVQEMELSWNPPKELSRSKLDSWYFRSSRRQKDSRTSVQFFPDVHDQLVKTLSAPQSACFHSATQVIFSHSAHLCPASAKTMGSDISLPSESCRMTAYLASKAYSSAGDGASVLHAMEVLQVFQAKLLQSLEGGTFSTDVVNDLRAATDFALMATKNAAQAIGRAMGFMVVP